ncbi:D-apionate lactonase [Glaciimonas sp. GG7]
MTTAQNLRYYGTALASDPGQRLCAGLLSVDFIDGGLRNIRYAGIEVLRAIHFVVRDKDWGTYTPALRNLHILHKNTEFRIAFDASCSDPQGQLLHYTVHIIGTASGRLQFEASYTAATDFVTARTGFCVLHPIAGVAGQAVVITHTDGSHEDAVFPELIAPWQPFKDISVITHQVAAGVQARCALLGDVFEMEDQRNWSDASFKTYVRPLARPWPYLIAQGETGTQSVLLTIEDHSASSDIPLPLVQPTVITLTQPGPAPLLAPKIGLAIAPEEIASTLDNIAALQALGVHVLLCHFDPGCGHGIEVLTGFAAIAAQYPGQYILECALPCVDTPAVELTAIAAQLKAAGFQPQGVVICPSVDRQSVPPGSPWPPCPGFEEIYQAARVAFPDLPLGGGMLSYFTELNRKRAPFEQLDWVTHATNPIVHAADDLSVMQTLETLPHITRSCRAMIGADQAYWIGPVTLGMRQNPYGSRTMPNPDQLRIPMASSDPRQQGLFGAAWLVGYAAQVASAGLAVLTLGGLVGPRGVLDQSERTPQFHVIAGLAQLAQAALMTCRSTHPEKILAIAGIDRQGRTSMWVANLSASLQSCHIDGQIPTGLATMMVLDEDGYQAQELRAAQDGCLLELLPYGCIHLLWK